MKDTLLIIVALAGLGAAIYEKQYAGPRAVADAWNASADEVRDLRAELDDMSEQLTKTNADNADLAKLLRESRETVATLEAKLEDATTKAAAAPVPGTTMPTKLVADPNEKAARLAAIDRELADLQNAKAAWAARRQVVATAAGGFTEQKVDALTGKKSGIRTSDADRKKFEDLRAAELARIDLEISRVNRQIADLQTRRAAVAAE